MSKRAAIGYDECGDEFVVVMSDNETLDNIRDNYPECRFTHVEDPYRDIDYWRMKYSDPDYDDYYDLEY